MVTAEPSQRAPCEVQGCSHVELLHPWHCSWAQYKLSEFKAVISCYPHPGSDTSLLLHGTSCPIPHVSIARVHRPFPERTAPHQCHSLSLNPSPQPGRPPNTHSRPPPLWHPRPPRAGGGLLPWVPIAPCKPLLSRLPGCVLVRPSIFSLDCGSYTVMTPLVHLVALCPVQSLYCQLLVNSTSK